jgi:hypothetical protein
VSLTDPKKLLPIPISQFLFKSVPTHFEIFGKGDGERFFLQRLLLSQLYAYPSQFTIGIINQSTSKNDFEVNHEHDLEVLFIEHLVSSWIKRRQIAGEIHSLA